MKHQKKMSSWLPWTLGWRLAPKHPLNISIASRALKCGVTSILLSIFPAILVTLCVYTHWGTKLACDVTAPRCTGRFVPMVNQDCKVLDDLTYHQDNG